MNQSTNPPTQGRSPIQQDGPKSITAFILLFDKLPRLNATHISTTISELEAVNQAVNVNIEVEEKDVLHAFIRFDNHQIRLAGFAAPVPPSTIERTIPVSNWKKEDKLPLQSHQAHVVCFYEGRSSDPAEQLISLYKTAYTFSNLGLLGLLDEDAWNCMPGWMVEKQMTAEMLRSCREAVPLGIWTGFIKLFKTKNDVWFCTKGYHRFGVRDLAYLGQLGDANDAFTIFGNLFHYMFEGATIKAGDTAQLSETEHLRFGNVYEHNDYLESPLGTLVFEKINASEVNKPAQ